MTTVQRIIKYLAIAFAIFLIVTIFTSVLAVINGLAGVLGLRNEEKVNISAGEISGMDFENKDIAIIEIDIAYANLKIKNGDNLRAETNSNYIECIQDGNKLKIEEKDHKWLSNSNDSELCVYIPQDLEFEKIEINTGAGEINIEKIVTKKLSFELGVGETRINTLNVSDDADIGGGAGKITIESGVINNLEFDMGIGEANISAKLTGKNKIDSGIGSLNINVNGNKEDYEITTSKGFGTIKIDNEEVADDEKIGNGSNSIDIDGGVGNIEMNFRDVP